MQTETSDTLYSRLRRHLDHMPVGFPATESGVEIRILKQLFTPEEAAIALELSAIPEPVEAIYKRLRSSMSLRELKEILVQMVEKGIILAYSAAGEMRYGKLVYAIGMYERQLQRLTPEFERDNRQYMEEAFGQAFHSRSTTQMRIVPVNRKIAAQGGVATYDRIRAHAEASPGPFAAITCICRHGADLLGESCRQTQLRDNCLMIGMAAQWAIGSGAGRELTRLEWLELLDQADREGLVLEVENTQQPMFVCCCCGCCCGVLKSAKRLPVPAEFFSSNFRAAVDGPVCDGCGDCLPRCQMDAISIPEGVAVIDHGRCIGCSLCVTDCPTGAMRLEPGGRAKVPPKDTAALYMALMQQRVGPLGMLKLGLHKALGMKY